MEILSQKLSEIPGSSAVIVSHDMHLAVSFADIIIKVRRKDGHGYIDSTSVFERRGDNNQWSNGIESFTDGNFENYLRKRVQ